MIPPITRNRWSGARTEPAIINPAINTKTRPTPVPINHSQLLVNVEISCSKRRRLPPGRSR